jgi:hypothetical protein
VTSTTSRTFRAMLLVFVVVAALAAATCAHQRFAAPGPRVESSAATDEVSVAGADADAPRDGRSALAAAARRPRARVAPAEPREPDPVVEESWFHEPAAEWETEKRIDLTGAQRGVVVAKWIAMADSGVELERRSDGKTVWRVHVEPLGIEHSKYHQEVTVRVDGDRVVVESVGARKIVEVRDLATGAPTSRDVTEVAR